MLTLKGITKCYSTGDTKVEALRGIDLEFGESEFAAILGPSGCGKTTLLNIIGGLDHYTDGDLIIRGKTTCQFKEHDWDTYRNHSVGFVFQSYNLIPRRGSADPCRSGGSDEKEAERDERRSDAACGHRPCPGQ